MLPGQRFQADHIGGDTHAARNGIARTSFRVLLFQRHLQNYRVGVRHLDAAVETDRRERALAVSKECSGRDEPAPGSRGPWHRPGAPGVRRQAEARATLGAAPPRRPVPRHPSLQRAQNRLTYPLFDTDRYRRHLEAAFTEMRELWRRGERPRSFAVERMASDGVLT